jgi:DNA repair protein RecN (Recombination protein N)
LAESAQNNREHDFNVHQFEELEKANLETIKQEELEGELKVLENAEAIQQNLNLCLDVLSTSELSVETGLKSAQTAMSQIAKFGKKFDELKARINSNLIELNDIVLEIEGEESELFFDNDRIVVIQDILNQLYTLQQKHQAESVEDLITLREELQAKMDRVLNFDEEVSKAKQLMESTLEVATETGEKLSATRVEVMPKIEKKLDKLLEGVGIPNGRVTINHATANLTSVGLDDINFLFSANKGMAPAPLKNAASGGEFSRLMLCIKYVLASKISLPTIIFDEIDTGVSGEVAIRVGNMLQDMAKGHQLMAITHLPQIAAKGKKHYFVFKDDSSEKTISLIKELTPDERIYEIAQMIGGHNPTETAYENARELIAMD